MKRCGSCFQTMLHHRFVLSLLLAGMIYSSSAFGFTISTKPIRNDALSSGISPVFSRIWTLPGASKINISACLHLTSRRNKKNKCLGIMASAGTENEAYSLPNVIVGGVFSLTGQDVARRLGRSSNVGRVSALVEDEDLMSLVVDDDGRTLAIDKVMPLIARNNVAAGNNNAPNQKLDVVVIATDDAPPAEAVKQIISDAFMCGATEAIMLSRTPPSADVKAWRLAETAATDIVGELAMSSLTILRTAELIGGPYYGLNMDLLMASNAKFITTSHQDFAISAASSSVNVRQKDVGTSRPIATKALEAALTLGHASTKTRIDDQNDNTDVATVSVLDVVSVEGPAPNEMVWEERVAIETRNAATPLPLPISSNKKRQTTEPFSAVATLAPLTAPQQKVFNNPFLAPPAVSGPYWFLVFLIVLGFGLASQEWTVCNEHWAVDPGSPFYMPVTEKTCACDDLYRVCKPVGELAEGSFRYFNKFVDGL